MKSALLSGSVLISGLEIESHMGSYSEHPMVIVHRMGSAERCWLTPDETRALARALYEQAQLAEGKPIAAQGDKGFFLEKDEMPF